MNRPLILISNDDGYSAKGIQELVKMMKHLGDVVVCAPTGPRSGRSRAFTMGPITIDHLRDDDGVEWWACSGTPVDCVKMAYGHICKRRPDLVIGGINHGDNASTNAHYSGTIGVAFEGCMKGIPSIAFSLCDYDPDADFTPMHDLVVTLCEKVLADGLPHYTCLNVNVPKMPEGEAVKGVRLCRMSQGYWRKEVEPKGKDSNGVMNYQLEGYYQSTEPEAEDTDAWAVAHGYTAITPCTIDITSYELMEKLKGMF